MKELGEEFDELTVNQQKILMPEGLIMLGARGSHAHGTFIPSEDPDSVDDIDLMGVYVAAPDFYFGFGADKNVEKYVSPDGKIKKTVGPEVAEIWVNQFDTVHYEVRKFIKMLMAANPNVITFLWIEPEDNLLFTPEGETLRANRKFFVSKKAYQSFVGYAHGQLERMNKLTPEILSEIDTKRMHLKSFGVRFEPSSGAPLMPAGLQENAVALVKDYESARKKYFGGFMGDKRRNLVKRVGYDSKNASHLIRLLRMGVEFLKTGEFVVKRTGLDAEELLDIKKGNWSLEEVKKVSSALFEEARAAYEKSKLPEESDRDGAELLTMHIIGSNLADRMSEA